MSKVLRAVIVDDEPLARRNIRSLLRGHSDIEVAAEAGTGTGALALLEESPVDLLFLDIQMPEMNGFEMLERLASPKLPVVIFVTAYDEFALRAFEVSATDYLLKPVDDGRFDQALSRARLQCASRTSTDLEARLLHLLAGRDVAGGEKPAEHPKRLVVKSASRTIFLQVADVDYIEANDYYAKIHVGPKSHLLRESMNSLESRLDPAAFVRIHRSVIVNVERIKELKRSAEGTYSMTLEGGVVLPLSRTRWEQVQALLSAISR